MKKYFHQLELKKSAIYFLLCCTLIQIFPLMAQLDQPIPSQAQNPELMQLPNPILKDSIVSLSLSHQQLINYWVYERRYKIWTEVSKPEADGELDAFDQQPLIDWNFSSPGLSDFGVEYRESSLYLPTNVQEFTEYKMGRTPFVPIASLALAGYLAQQIYNRYGHLLKAREESRYRGVELTGRQIHMMQLLWQEKSYMPSEWYSSYFKKYKDDNITFTIFNREIDNLENSFLLKKREFEDGTVKYFPAISREELNYQLKKELDVEEARPGSPRPDTIKWMLKNINE
jgi:hypothetical protein